LEVDVEYLTEEEAHRFAAIHDCSNILFGFGTIALSDTQRLVLNIVQNYHGNLVQAPKPYSRKHDHQFRILMLGDPLVGKSSLQARFTKK